ncbi:DUF1294 domain-containing protein [Proteiniclasticum sp. SCR006]|uniref:DUF1294 domain-containing protein n=1 Tax=Proteiniclasticum aestuarii TaxID=2817862 RepID=A0A939H9H4_9CLOT|nr:DUF1294 domain-containing protein [Proteiniclasticum aestuarii]MBO1263857.1 DUF1294 domain-containing protein [Proteiniclasticum aestuarii]
MNYLFGYILFINIFSLIIMHIDKNKARKHRWRVSESSLMILGFLGGSIGLLVGMYALRHKTKHVKFTLGVPMLLLLNLLIYVLFNDI